MANQREGLVTSAKTNPLRAPTQASPVRAMAEKTISVWPHGRKRVKKPNKKVGRG